MRQITKQDYKKAMRDRWWFGLAVFNVIVSIVVVVFISLSIQPKETQVITQFSSFGITGFYRNYWYYLWGYVLLAVIILTTNIAMSLKLHQLKRRDLALALLWSTLGLSVVVLLFANSIIKIATLG